MATATADRIFPGIIERDVLYTVAEFKARLKLGDWALRQARRRGLRVRAIGRERYVMGSDALDWLERTK